MSCNHCGYENRENANFCTHCGSPLALICHTCHTPAQEGDIYCATCGSRLPVTGDIKTDTPLPLTTNKQTTSTPISTKTTHPEENVESERKTVTVLFGDLSGFTAMSEKLDPEDVTTIMNNCLQMMGDTVVAYEGYIDKFIGDCIMAIFGAPISHENDPELAIRAALDMSKKIKEYNKELPIKLEKPLSLHIGINTGLVVAGKMGSDSKLDYTIMGDTVNLASRLESKAGANQTFISAYTHNQVKNLFEFIKHDPVEVKGKRDPVSVYEVVRALELEEIKGGSSTEIPLVGRTQEVAILKSCSMRLLQGEGQAIFLISDPGFGKSRVQIELKRQFEQGEVQYIEGRCHSFGRNTPYHLFIDLFKRLCAIDADDLQEAMQEKLSKGIPLMLGEDKNRLSDESKHAIVFIGNLLNLNLSEEYDIPLNEMSNQEINTATIRAIAWIFSSMAKRKPLVFSLEDLHYADAASVEIIAALIHAVKTASIMLILSMRPEKNTPSSKLEPQARRILGDRMVEVTFERLTRDDCEIFVKYLLGSENLPKELLELVGLRSDGNPLFLQEIIRSLLDNKAIEKGDNGEVKILKDLSKVTIPSSITGLIMARFDQLSAESRDILSKASVIGPSFSHQLIAALIHKPNLDSKLNALIDAEMIFESQSFPEIEYAFHTTFIQEAVYDTLLLKRRRSLHKEVAQTIESLFGEHLQDQLEALAHHYLEANDIHRAYEYLVKSGLKAKAAFANESASRFLLEAIAVGANIKNPKPPITELEESYSSVLELLGDMEGAIKAWERISSATEDVLTRANAMRNIGRLEEKRGSKETAITVYEDALKLLEAHQDSDVYGLLMMNLSWVLNRFHRTEEAVEKAQFALGLFEKHAMEDNIALCCNNLAVFYENLNQLDTALEYNLRSLEIFTKLKNRRQIGNVELSLGYLRAKRGEMDEALEHFSRSADSMDRISNRVGIATALLAKGRSYSDIHKFDEAELSLLSALRHFKELEMDRRIVATSISLINVLLDKKDVLKARERVNETMEIAKTNDFKSDIGKLLRLSARINRFEGKDEEAEKLYQQAFDLFTELGREKDAKSVEKEWKA